MSSALLVSAGILLGTLFSLEAGFRWGRRDIARNSSAHEGIGAVEASAFGLLGLLLAFSFAGAMSRLESKRELIVAEANAIGTAYRRLDLLPPDARPLIREQFKRLIEARIRAYESRLESAVDRDDFEAITETQDRIWSLAVAAAAPSKDMALLVLPPITEMIDVGTARTVAFQAHLPTLILDLLVGAALTSGLLAGYAMARRGHRSWFHAVAYAALIALTVYTVIDLDRPRFGLINIDAAYQPFIELRDLIK